MIRAVKRNDKTEQETEYKASNFSVGGPGRDSLAQRRVINREDNAIRKIL